MKYFVDVNQNHADSIQALINKGRYSSVAQFISVAIENQIYLERTEEQPPFENVSVQNVKRESQAVYQRDVYQIKNITTEPQIVPMSSSDQTPLGANENGAKGMWIWGQINKILPVKIGLRILYKELGNDQFIDLERYADKAVELAVKISNEIREHEDKVSKTRDDKISAALPTDEEGSQTRYRSQFLMYKRKDNLMDGALALMKFANIVSTGKGGKPLLGITKAGVEFAKLSNPVLDNFSFEDRLSEEEIQFYLNHIKKNVENEYSAIKWMLGKINKGINERESINNELRNDFGKKWGASDAVINTQRSGLTSRMSELKLVEKKKNGIRVTYYLSQSGKYFLTNK